MDTVLRLLFFEVLGLGVIATAVKGFYLHDRWLKSRHDAEDRLLRSPGESLRRENQNLNEWLMGLLGGIAFTPAILLGQMPKTIGGGSIAVMMLATLAWAVPLVYLLRRRRNLELALRAQRAVAEELNRLMLQGFQVFHDFPAGPAWNIHHIVVGPTGVYAIETRTTRKPALGKERVLEVSFDGTKVKFSRACDAAGFDQARRKSSDLARELASVADGSVEVKPILTFPGWAISRKGQGDVNVLNPQEIRQAVFSEEKPRLSQEQIQRIARHIEQKCRDVEL